MGKKRMQAAGSVASPSKKDKSEVRNVAEIMYPNGFNVELTDEAKRIYTTKVGSERGLALP